MEGECGITGVPSWLWRAFTGSLPPFEHCCHKHDYGYDNVITSVDREQRDYEIRACIESTGYTKVAKGCFYTLRYFGWIAIVKRDVIKFFKGE